MRNIFTLLRYWAENQFQKVFRLRYSQDMHDMMSLDVMQTHIETFGKYKNAFQGKDIAIIATGPSLNNFKPIEDVTYIGLNKAFMRDNIKFDYIFMQDWGAVKDYIENITDEKYKDIIKFYGVAPLRYFGKKRAMTTPSIMPESVILRHKAKKYFLYVKSPQYPIEFNVDIDKNWLQDCTSVAFSAMQFALFTNPRKIYLIGCDCSSGYFDGTKSKLTANHLVPLWKEIKKFKDIYYPETEIISVNPIGLKGIFTDLYQDN